jgi:hypothetical protein
MNTLLNIVKAQIHGGGKFEMQSEPTATSSPLRSRVTHYHGTLAALTLIILFSETLKFSSKKFKEQNFVKETIGFSGILYLLK